MLWPVEILIGPSFLEHPFSQESISIDGAARLIEGETAKAVAEAQLGSWDCSAQHGDLRIPNPDTAVSSTTMELIEQSDQSPTSFAMWGFEDAPGNYIYRRNDRPFAWCF